MKKKNDTKKPCILVVVEDDSVSCDLITQILPPGEYKVISVSSAEEALCIIKEKKISLVLTGSKLPKMDGLTLIGKIKKYNTHIPIIVLTGYARDYDAAHAFSLGADDYIEKPYSPVQLIESISKLLGEKISFKKAGKKVHKSKRIGKPAILIVDDDESIRVALEVILSDEGYKVETIPSATSALKSLEKQVFDVIISDIQMPQMDGFKFLESLRKKNIMIPFIMITGHSAKYDALDAFHKGAWDYIEKPFHAKDVIYSVQRALEKRRFELDRIKFVKKISDQKDQLEKTLNKLKNMEVQLVQAGKLAALGQLGAGIAHEINQPLTIVKGYSQIFQKKKGELSDEDRKCLARVNQEVNRIASIIDNLRQFAESEKRPLNIHDVSDPIRNAMMLFQQDFKLKNIRLLEKLDLNLPKVKIKRTDFQQVMINLLVNAREAIEENGKKGGIIKVESYLDKNQFVCVTISDNGVGMSREVQDQIFDPFFTTKDVGERHGQGLGLSLSYGIVRSFDGEILVKSKKGKGSLFTIRLPIDLKKTKQVKKAA